MNEREFNLIYEPWILAMRPDGSRCEVSLLEIFRDAGQYLRLAGELPTQDVAILRLLLAIMHASLARFDIDDFNGDEEAVEEACLSLWKDTWDAGVLPCEIIETYLKKWEDRFWLFDKERPFYQVASMESGTKYSAAKLNGELSESTNKARLFPVRTGRGKSELSAPEAARWLINVNAFDDTSAKPKQKGLGSPGAGWLGKLGLVYAEGASLFETLMLNLVLLKDDGELFDSKGMPTWELNEPRAVERCEIIMPDTPSQLLTLQSRRLLLHREEGTVVGLSLLGGDYFDKTNAFSEQMTAWRLSSESKNKPIPEYVPRRHNPQILMWRNFSALVLQNEGARRPGIVSWLIELKVRGLLDRRHICFRIAAIKYGDKDFFAEDVFTDSLSINSGLLTTFDDAWTLAVLRNIAITSEAVWQLGKLATNIALACGSDEDKAKGYRSSAMEQVYYLLDMPFREWLASIDPAIDDFEDKMDAWLDAAIGIVRKYGNELVTNVGDKALVGRPIKERVIAAPQALNDFMRFTSVQALKSKH